MPWRFASSIALLICPPGPSKKLYLGALIIGASASISNGIFSSLAIAAAFSPNRPAIFPALAAISPQLAFCTEPRFFVLLLREFMLRFALVINPANPDSDSGSNQLPPLGYAGVFLCSNVVIIRPLGNLSTLFLCVLIAKSAFSFFLSSFLLSFSAIVLFMGCTICISIVFAPECMRRIASFITPERPASCSG